MTVKGHFETFEIGRERKKNRNLLQRIRDNAETKVRCKKKKKHCIRLFDVGLNSTPGVYPVKRAMFHSTKREAMAPLELKFVYSVSSSAKADANLN